MSSEENKVFVMELCEQFWNAGNLALIAEQVSLERIDHDPGGPAAGEVAGCRGLRDQGGAGGWAPKTSTTRRDGRKSLSVAIYARSIAQ